MFDSCSSVFKKLEKEFEAKTYILGRIQHSNIVKLLCCISNEDSKLLVYESWRMGAWTAGSMGRQTEGLIQIQVGLELEGWIGRRGSRLQLGLLKVYATCTIPALHPLFTGMSSPATSYWILSSESTFIKIK
eukprot:TRINITY_DN8486_c0_g2_i3.p1 TRINITY_DN8486_c0_g2~~TRINITY_DN8486_c0_g2_i3.p1  ORF type:complete len:132 (+),score=25.09 TRINITY_DN8486_c0_g2_i3:486-881(+)